LKSNIPPFIAFIEEIGWIEIGQHEVISPLSAYDQSGTVYEGKASYPNMKLHFRIWKQD